MVLGSITRSSQTYACLPAIVNRFLFNGRILDVSQIRQRLADIDARLGSDVRKVDDSCVSDEMRIASICVSSRAFEARAMKILSKMHKVPEVNRVNVEALVGGLSAIVDSPLLSTNRTADGLFAELCTSRRINEIAELRSRGLYLQVLRVMLHSELYNNALLTTCVEGMLGDIGSLSVPAIIDTLKCKLKWGVKHQEFTDAIVYLLPVLPCSDSELEVLVELLLTSGVDNEDDVDFLKNLVRYRSVLLPE